MELVERLTSGEFEFSPPIMKRVYYAAERQFGHMLLRRRPPADSSRKSPLLLNLGCGPHLFPDWINADDYGFKRLITEKRFRPNWMLDITRPWRCDDIFWDGIFSEHVVEHLTYSEGVGVFRECLRTLKPRAWLRLSVPDLGIFARYYTEGFRASDFTRFPRPALTMSAFGQMHLHRSMWDGALLTEVLAQVGFVEVGVVEFGRGSDPRLIKDDPDKEHQSLYVEARKP